MKAQDRSGKLEHAKKLYHIDNQYILQAFKNRTEKEMVSQILTVDLSNRCNYSCPFCIDGGLVNSRCSSYFIDFELLKKLLNESKLLGAKCLEITGGGEPLTYRKFDELVAYATELGYRVSLITNGYFIRRHEKIFSSITFDWIRVSLDTTDRYLYGKIHGCGYKMYDRVIDNLKWLAKVNNLGISFVILEENIEDIVKCATLAKDIGAKYFEIKPLMTGDGNIFEYNSEILACIYKNLHIIEQLSDDKFSIIYPKSLRSYFRGKVSPSPLPSNVDEMIAYRNMMIEGIEPRYDCPLYCGRHYINEAIDFEKNKLVDTSDMLTDDIEDVLWL